MGDTYYEIMGVPRTASPADIKARYRKLILRIHPDLDGPPALFRQVQEAYEVLSDPVRRASYDRLLQSRRRAERVPPMHRRHDSPASSPRSVRTDPYKAAAGAGGRSSGDGRSIASVLRRHPAATLAMGGAVLLVLGAAMAGVGIALLLLGSAALVIAGMAALGSRGAKERRAYQRSGMTAVDAMSERQFEVLLEHFFASTGYRVARIGGRRDVDAGLLLNDAGGRMIVHVRRWNGVVRHDAVHQAVAAMARYGATRALVVTSSRYSPEAVAAANSCGVALWNRADLAAELTVFRVPPARSGIERLSSELRAGCRICLGFLAAIFVALMALPVRRGRPSSATRRYG